MSDQRRRARDDAEGPNIEREVGPEDKFSILRNEVIGDETLTWEARGMLAFLLSKPPHWKVSVKHLINQTEQARKHLKRDGVHEVLRELIHAGEPPHESREHHTGEPSHQGREHRSADGSHES